MLKYQNYKNKYINIRRAPSQLFEKKSWVAPWSRGKHSCLSPRNPKFESTLKSSKKWTQKLSVQFYFFIHFMHVYITKDDIKVAKVQSNLSKITIPFWTVCSRTIRPPRPAVASTVKTFAFFPGEGLRTSKIHYSTL